MKPGPRWIHRLYATVTGYFWMPCAVCSRPFGGHEFVGAYSIPTSPSSARAVCSAACAILWRIDRLNERHFIPRDPGRATHY